MPTNLRILKKLSKRAAPWLERLGDHRQQFRAARGENYHGCVVTDLGCWERRRCRPDYQPFGEEVLRVSRSGATLLLSPPPHPLPGTVMVGAVSGYYEPEWHEECAWEALDDLVRWHFVEWGDGEEADLVPTRRIRSVSDVFAAAADMAADLEAHRAALAAELQSLRVARAA